MFILTLPELSRQQDHIYHLWLMLPHVLHEHPLMQLEPHPLKIK